MRGVEVQIGVPSEVKGHEYRVGVTPAGAAHLVIIGGGKVGANAARIGVGVGADVTLLDNSPLRLRHLEDVFGARLKTLHATPHAIAGSVRDADLVVGAVLLPAKCAATAVAGAHRRHDSRIRVDRCLYRSGRYRGNLTPDHTLRADPTSKRAWSTTASRTCRAGDVPPPGRRSRSRLDATE